MGVFAAHPPQLKKDFPNDGRDARRRRSLAAGRRVSEWKHQ